jgi:hypothetical protein
MVVEVTTEELFEWLQQYLFEEGIIREEELKFTNCQFEGKKVIVTYEATNEN